LKSVISINHIKTTPTHTKKRTTKQPNKQTNKPTNQPTNQQTRIQAILNFEGTASQQNKMNTLNYFLFKMSWEFQGFSAVLIILGHQNWFKFLYFAPISFTQPRALTVIQRR